MSNIDSLSFFFNDPAYRPGQGVMGVCKVLKDIVRKDYIYESNRDSEAVRYRMRVSFRVHEKSLGDTISFHIKENKRSGIAKDNQGFRHDVPIESIMTDHDFMFFQSLMMTPFHARDSFDQGSIYEATEKLALKLEAKMDFFGILSLEKIFNRPPYELQRGILDLYADYRSDIFFRSIASEKARREAGPSF